MITEEEKQNIIKSILNIRCREGATVSDVQDDFKDFTGQSLFDAHSYLSTIDSVYCDVLSNGAPKWYVKSSKSEHVSKLVREQKTAIQQQQQQQQQHQFIPKPQHVLNDSIDPNDCFFKDNFYYKLRRLNRTFPQSPELEDINNNANGCVSYYKFNPNVSPPKRSPMNLHAQLVGDNFFRALATRDANDHTLHRNGGAQQMGFCVSGQTISSAARQIERAPFFKASHLILNVGTVDILRGRSLADMCTDFDHLIDACARRGCEPIITTLVPLTNGTDPWQMCKQLCDFNRYLWDKYSLSYAIIDICPLFLSRSGDTLDFETGSMYTNGNEQPHGMWGKSSRHRIRSHISKRLHKILNMNTAEHVRWGA